MKLLSDQVSEQEVRIILNELQSVISLGIAGDVVELGCYVGTTSIYLQQALLATTKKLYLYDSFEGLPKKTTEDKSPLGEQFKAGELYASKAVLIKHFKQAGLPLPVVKKAWFSELTPQDLPQKIALAFLDGDYYQSIIDSLTLVWPKLTPGSVVVIDDYQNEQLPGVAKAVNVWSHRHSFTCYLKESLAIIQPKL